MTTEKQTPGAQQEPAEGLTAKEAWWAGARAGLGVPPDMPREQVAALLPAPPVQQGPMGREGCNYMCKPGKVCRKCGHVHDIPLTAPPAPAAEKEADDAAQ